MKVSGQMMLLEALLLWLFCGYILALELDSQLHETRTQLVEADNAIGSRTSEGGDWANQACDIHSRWKTKILFVEPKVLS